MQIIEDLSELELIRSQYRNNNLSVAFVPTMGNLHAGHLSLVEAARKAADKVVVSIFVNPLQFGAHEDLDAYPKTLEADQQKLAAAGVDLLFLPVSSQLYPQGLFSTTKVLVAGLSSMLCGASRPGHFEGVATVVNILFNIVGPDVALFGKKDYQQLRVIEKMVDDLRIPVEVRGVATVREVDGLAMSSRNSYLASTERSKAPRLYAELSNVREKLMMGKNDYLQIEQEAITNLANHGLRPDYVSIRQLDTLELPGEGCRSDLVVLAAASLGKARLIDNIEVQIPKNYGV